MNSTSYVAALAPIPRLIETHTPPIGKKILIVTIYGNGYAGTYDKNDDTQWAWGGLLLGADCKKGRV